MTSKSARLLETKISRIVKATIPRVARPIGSEDMQELIQDTLASAAEMIQSMEDNGKEPIPNSIVKGRFITSRQCSNQNQQPVDTGIRYISYSPFSKSFVI